MHSVSDSCDRGDLYRSGQKKSLLIHDKENIDPLQNADHLQGIEKSEQICLRIVDCERMRDSKNCESTQREDECLSFMSKSRSVCQVKEIDILKIDLTAQLDDELDGYSDSVESIPIKEVD